MHKQCFSLEFLSKALTIHPTQAIIKYIINDKGEKAENLSRLFLGRTGQGVQRFQFCFKNTGMNFQFEHKEN